MIRIDLHTHSIASPDGGIALEEYQKVLDSGMLQSIAITDHDRIDFAVQAQLKLGSRIIIGEEISTTEGEIIGLYLSEKVAPGQTPAATVAAIRAQGGLVYVPHPFETVRKGLSFSAMRPIIDDIDIIETYNGRALLQNKSERARRIATQFSIVKASSSDAHGAHGWGRTYTEISDIPTRDSLVELLLAANYSYAPVGLQGVMYPKYNRLKKRFSHL